MPSSPALPPERIDGGPVILRRLSAADAGAVAIAVSLSLEHLRPWMPWATPGAPDRRSQLARVVEADQNWESGTAFTYCVMTSDHGTLVGEIAMHRLAGEGKAEIGYWIAASQVRHGFGSSAARAITQVALALPGVLQVEIHCDAANVASAALARKLGYRLDRVEACKAEAPGESGRMMIWVLTADD